MLWRDHTVNWGQLPLVSGLGPSFGNDNASWNWLSFLLGLETLSKSYQSCRGQPLLVWGSWTFEKFLGKSVDRLLLGRLLLWRSCWNRLHSRVWVWWSRVSGRHQGGLNGIRRALVSARSVLQVCFGWCSGMASRWPVDTLVLELLGTSSVLDQGQLVLDLSNLDPRPCL